ncbi:hypothetical protein BDZ97DRAFT_1916071 [Flammula alnicola]|nr:hypothetical protein BDZ97DRAFT_1916071 [Flammula alnicola]
MRTPPMLPDIRSTTLTVVDLGLPPPPPSSLTSTLSLLPLKTSKTHVVLYDTNKPQPRRVTPTSLSSLCLLSPGSFAVIVTTTLAAATFQLTRHHPRLPSNQPSKQDTACACAPAVRHPPRPYTTPKPHLLRYLASRTPLPPPAPPFPPPHFGLQTYQQRGPAAAASLLLHHDEDQEANQHQQHYWCFDATTTTRRTGSGGGTGVTVHGARNRCRCRIPITSLSAPPFDTAPLDLTNLEPNRLRPRNPACPLSAQPPTSSISHGRTTSPPPALCYTHRPKEGRRSPSSLLDFERRLYDVRSLFSAAAIIQSHPR